MTTNVLNCQNRWDEAEAKKTIENYANLGVNEDIALRTYSARLLGSDPQLVLHGGGNTSVKTFQKNLLGESIQVLCVKGSGWDLATIEPEGHPAVALEPLQILRKLNQLSDEDMVATQRKNLLDIKSPNPSVETLLHAFLPDKFVDHTHSTSLLAIADQPNAAQICQEIYGNRVAIVPYVMPGFDLAIAAAKAYEAAQEEATNKGTRLDGMILLKHGIFSFGETAKESYDRMIELVNIAEERIKKSDVTFQRERPSENTTHHENIGLILPIIRGMIGRISALEGHSKHWILAHRDTDLALMIANHNNLDDFAKRGVATPDHVIRTKAFPLILPALPDSFTAKTYNNFPNINIEIANELSIWIDNSCRAITQYIDEYKAYFQRQNARVGGGKTMLDPLPRLLILPGFGFIGLGTSLAQANIVNDIGEVWATTLAGAEAVGHFRPVSEDDTFDLEYWSLEQAKLGKSKEQELARQIVVITGGASGIGSAVAKEFAKQGAEIAILDINQEAAITTASQCGKNAIGIGCDVTNPRSVSDAILKVTTHFGGLDLVVSNAGAAWNQAISNMNDNILRQSFELNFFSHQHVSQAAVAIYKLQDSSANHLTDSPKIGGCLLYNASKQALNPGPNFGAYGIAKAALIALMRQYALEEGSNNIRSNAINADRIRSGLLDAEMISTRSNARGISEEEYMSGNLLKQEVRSSDVAEAFVALAKMQRTTGALVTVDGGNVAAMVR